MHLLRVMGSSDQAGDLKRQVDMFLRIFDSTENGIIITDPDGYILYLNASYGQFLEVDSDAQVGRHCSEVVDNSRMHIVGRTGKPELNQIQNLHGVNILVERIPVKRYGQVIAVFGRVLFSDLNKMKRLARTVEALDESFERYGHRDLRVARFTFDSIVGESELMIKVRSQAGMASTNAFPVLICGESGTGKELFAQAIHNLGPRQAHPFVTINCAAIPENLLESELFGYDPGAFTGAMPRGKAGKFELAHRGTVFLDEIGDMPTSMQPKLLRVLEEKRVERVGGNRVIPLDFRVISATNQDLKKLMGEGRFRSDLYYRLNVIPLHIPPLRDRAGDIPLLAEHLIENIAGQAGRPPPSFLPDALQLLENYTWPGNVRELANALERAFTQSQGDHIRGCDLPDAMIPPEVRSAAMPRNLHDLQEHTEREAIQAALDSCGFNKSQAARQLGIHRTLLYKKIRKYNLPLRPDGQV
ncbi:sigma-54 interaction domain-containing protein [Desulfosarcina sp.]|uniref:sigma-54 interaction domain-containing protein n=1 Tax=Desulfosarcina sp. TaxID=2027861 RepID=UPI0029A6545E|nr:sigma 54-interacting transcriptional regulator [Desulfosarcina sp.]MDX2454693.1 sigma 54-interacting transcriptional regulator [Desulfosarcina sp.]